MTLALTPTPMRPVDFYGEELMRCIHPYTWQMR